MEALAEVKLLASAGDFRDDPPPRFSAHAALPLIVYEVHNRQHMKFFIVRIADWSKACDPKVVASKSTRQKLSKTLLRCGHLVPLMVWRHNHELQHLCVIFHRRSPWFIPNSLPMGLSHCEHLNARLDKKPLSRSSSSSAGESSPGGTSMTLIVSRKQLSQRMNKLKLR